MAVKTRVYDSTKIQGVSEGKISILGIDGIGHCKKEVRMYMRITLNGYRDGAVCIYKHKEIVNDTKQRKITYCEFNVTLN
jgi:hypothetical protein